jgi:hypothetical protein
MNADPTPQLPPPASAAAPQPPHLLDQLRQTARQRGHPEPTVAAFADWSRRFLLFHGKRHPRELFKMDGDRLTRHLAGGEVAR